jgi:large subunit ribosomal protein L29
VSKHAEAIDKLRALSDEELHTHLMQQRRKLFEIRLQQATGQVENTSQIRVIRKEIARAMTVQMEAERTQ